MPGVEGIILISNGNYKGHFTTLRGRNFITKFLKKLRFTHRSAFHLLEIKLFLVSWKGLYIFHLVSKFF